MSQVLYPNSPNLHSAPITLSAAASNTCPSTLTNLATSGTIASSTSSSSRPRRAAAIASQATCRAVVASDRRKSSLSTNKSTSHPSAKTASSSTPQKGAQAQSSPQEHQQQIVLKDDPSKRVMAALPRSKRPRRGAAAEDTTLPETFPHKLAPTNGRGTDTNGASKNSIMMGIDSALTNGYGHTSYEGSLGGASQYAHQQLLAPSTSTSSTGGLMPTSASVREMINGQETEIFVVDSASPPASTTAVSSVARGKRKAAVSPSNGSAKGGVASYDAGSTIVNNAAMTASKRRRKDGNGLPSAQSAQAINGGPPEAGHPSSGAAVAESSAGAGAAKKSLASYRGGYNADVVYQSPNGTKWTDTLDNPYHPARYNVPIDDSEGHYIIREGNMVAGRYQIKGLLGQGTFGKVVRCKDTLRDREVAIKIIRSIQKYTDAAQIEIRVLKALRSHDPHNENKCIHLIDTFTYHNHVCIVSELLGKSVFDFLKENGFHPFPCKDIWSFARQLLRSVAFLHELGLVHTDLKPENILLVNNDFDIVPLTKRANSRKKRALRDSEIRLIDFGSATFNEEYHSQVVSTRHYRAPEIILQMGWSHPCDAWSIGCILIEFYTGEALFQTHDNLEHLAMMETVLGPMPDDFRRKAETYRPQYFYAGRLDYPNPQTTKQSRRFVKAMRTIDDTINSGAAYSKHDQRFKHLLKRLLTFDPSQRIRVDQALKHPYFDLAPNEIP